MSWQPLHLRGISFIGQGEKTPASLEFRSGLNVICGSSETGKSFLVETIDFLLGARDPLIDREISELEGYDRARVVIERTDIDEVFTLERNTTGGNLKKFPGNWLLSNPDVEPAILQWQHSPNNTNNLSTFLLHCIGLENNKRIRKNSLGETQSLSFRNLVNLVVIQEDNIHNKKSPFLSTQKQNHTADYSALKFLLTELDDSFLTSQAERQAEIANIKKANNAKIEFIDELLRDFQAELSSIEIDPVEAANQLSVLEAEQEAQKAALDQAQGQFNERIEQRRNLSYQQQTYIDRINEIDGLLSRFELLQRHYQVDIERLEAIQESGSLFVHLEQLPCPLCGSPANEQHYQEMCDGNIELNINAATAEIAKINKLSTDLTQTIEDLRVELEDLNILKEELNPQIESLNQEIQEILSPALGEAQNSFSELVSQANEIRRAIDLINRIAQMDEKKTSLLNENVEYTNATQNITTDLSTEILDQLTQKVKNLLQAWNFPNCDRVYFDPSKKDIVLNGKSRKSQGKGLRAITHAAMTIALMEFCKEKNLSHPGFVVLDSPLLAYYKPEGKADNLQGSDLKFRFYEYLANNHEDSQIIIIENEHPSEEIKQKIAFTVFTKNPLEGRYGLLPIR